ncbi:nitrous oxide reductase accessory protein NosL [Rhodothermus marinus]|uniref:nitrous oxide reductase accessory protein NosL n=1 Tax=Rhodothermus marinus TaxID=29549 RepID=UPI0037C8E97D
MAAILYSFRPSWFYLLSLLLLLGACRPAPEPDRPPVIRFGHDACDYCRMLIGEPRYAAALRTADGQERRFDDIGCLLHYLHEHPEAADARIWVHDYLQERWLRAPQAFFVRSDRLITPMGYGIVALGDSLAADSLAHTLGGTFTRFDTLRANPPPEPARLR